MCELGSKRHFKVFRYFIYSTWEAVGKCIVLTCFAFVFATINYRVVYAVRADLPEVKFLFSINTLQADFVQKQYDGEDTDDNNIVSRGTVTIKKPDSILLENDSKNMRLKIVSINGNVKMIDKDIRQTTYVDNQYGEMMRFFTKNMKPEELSFNTKRELCIKFKKMDTNLSACLKLDLNKRTIVSLTLYSLGDDGKNDGKHDNSLKIFDIFFKNIKINSAIDDDVFVIKDERLFDDSESM